MQLWTIFGFAVIVVLERFTTEHRIAVLLMLILLYKTWSLHGKHFKKVVYV